MSDFAQNEAIKEHFKIHKIMDESILYFINKLADQNESLAARIATLEDQRLDLQHFDRESFKERYGISESTFKRRLQSGHIETLSKGLFRPNPARTAEFSALRARMLAEKARIDPKPPREKITFEGIIIGLGIEIKHRLK
jgi:hypothetical protein